MVDDKAAMELVTSMMEDLDLASYQYRKLKAKDEKSLAKSFHEAGDSLSLLITAFGQVKIGAANFEDDVVTSLQSCSVETTKLDAIFGEVARASTDERLKVYMSSAGTKGGKPVEVLVGNLMTDVRAVADSLGMTDDVKAQLDEAIQKLSDLKSSLPHDDSAGGVYNHYGSGTQNNAPGGVVNQSSGEGFHFAGATVGNFHNYAPPPKGKPSS